MIVDFHSHAFPERIAQRALESITACSGGLRPRHDGTAASLRAVEEAAGVDHCVLLNIATSPAQQKNVNDFAKSVDGGFFTAFGSVHPDAPDALDELDRIAEMGLRGIKLHAQYQQFTADDDCMLPIYERIADLGLITVFHAGVDIGMVDPWGCTPARLRRILPVFRGTPVVAAHLGSFLLWNEVEQELVGQDVYFDTSFCYGNVPVSQTLRIIRTHGADRVLFGSDLPWSSPENEIRYLRYLDLTEDELTSVLGGNAQRLLGLPR